MCHWLMTRSLLQKELLSRHTPQSLQFPSYVACLRLKPYLRLAPTMSLLYNVLYWCIQQWRSGERGQSKSQAAFCPVGVSKRCKQCLVFQSQDDDAWHYTLAPEGRDFNFGRLMGLLLSLCASGCHPIDSIDYNIETIWTNVLVLNPTSFGEKSTQ